MRTRVMLFGLAGAFWPGSVLACPVCFGATDAPMVRGSNLGILALLIVTALMLGAFGYFFRTLSRREKQWSSDSVTEPVIGRNVKV